MNVKEAAMLIGKRGHYSHGELKFLVEVVNVRSVFGRTDIEVKPIAGEGQGWARLDSIRMIR